MTAQQNSWIRILKNGTPEVIYSKEMVAFQQATIFVAHVSFGHEVAISWMRQLDETEMLTTKGVVGEWIGGTLTTRMDRHRTWFKDGGLSTDEAIQLMEEYIFCFFLRSLGVNIICDVWDDDQLEEDAQDAAVMSEEMVRTGADIEFDSIKAEMQFANVISNRQFELAQEWVLRDDILEKINLIAKLFIETPNISEDGTYTLDVPKALKVLKEWEEEWLGSVC
ncbi:MAG: hypothetical protein ACJ0KD_05045 [Dehalococcoidia bacterium]